MTGAACPVMLHPEGAPLQHLEPDDAGPRFLLLPLANGERPGETDAREHRALGSVTEVLQ